MLPKTIANILLKLKAVSLSLDQPFTYASGIKSPIYCDNRVVISHPKERNEIVTGFASLMETHKISGDVIAGTATAGISWAAWLADQLNLPMIYVRSASKEHGKGNQIEGQLAPEQKVILIEDLVSTGGSSVKAIQAIQENGNDVVACLAIFNYQMAKATSAFDEIGVPLYTLSNFTDLIELASEQGLISDQQMHMALEWNKDPEGWGKKHGFE